MSSAAGWYRDSVTAATWGEMFGGASVSAMRVYEHVMVPRLFEPWARLLLKGLDLQTGERVLDVACGPGSVSRLVAAAVGSSGRVVGCDLSGAMLTIAREKPPIAAGASIEYHEAPADQLPVSDGVFDVAVCQQGLQFFPDRTAALGEMRRALRQGGRLAVAVWTEIGESPLFAALQSAVRDVAGDELARRYGAGPWGMPEQDQLRRLIEQAGFSSVRVSRAAEPMEFEGGATQLAATLTASGIAAEIAALAPEQRVRLGRAIEAYAAPFVVGEGLRANATSHIAYALR
jgi:ubiquinone/menaquinone biosynthesis C-methylase UbiE